LDSCLVLLELLVRHSRPANQREQELTSFAMGDNTHGVMNADTRIELDVMIQNAELIFGCELDPRFPERGLDNPIITISLNF